MHPTALLPWGAPHPLPNAFGKEKSYRCLLQEAKLLFTRAQPTGGVEKAGDIYLDAEKWVCAECFPGPIQVAALGSSTRHLASSPLSACQNKSSGTTLSRSA